MTGYGRGMVEKDGVEVACEVRSVNHRFLDLGIRLPGPLLSGEARIAARLRSRFERGRLEVTFRRRGAGGAASQVRVDLALARSYLDALQKIGAHLHVTAAVDAVHLAERPGVLAVEEEADVDEELARCEQALDLALAMVVRMRTVEGERLAADLGARCDRLAELAGQVAEAVRDAVPKAVEQLRERLAQLLQGVAVDEARLVQEAALVADRADIHEEIARLGSHVQQVREALAQGGAVGRRLDFLAQELHREVNTMGSKATDLAARRLIVEMKGEVEKIREQAQNVE
ncbi:YicC family protein [Myxococcota bacterium]|nr:YicC family protein [Myxococcota bacterium]